MAEQDVTDFQRRAPRSFALLCVQPGTSMQAGGLQTGIPSSGVRIIVAHFIAKKAGFFLIGHPALRRGRRMISCSFWSLSVMSRM